MYKSFIFLIALLFCSLVQAQTNNTCATALAHGNVTANSCSPTTFNVGGANVANAAPVLANCAPGTINNVDEAWISFVAQSTTTVFEYTNTTRDAAVYIYSGTCGTLVLEGCSDAVTGQGTDQVVFTTIIGQMYFARIIRESGNNNQFVRGSYCVYQGCTNQTYTNGSNALYTTCTPVTPRNPIVQDGACYNGNITNKRICFANNVSCMNVGEFVEFVSFVPTTSNVQINYTDGTAGTVDIAVIQNTGTCAAPTFTFVDCITNVSASGPYLTTGLTIGTQYWLAINANSANVGTYNVCVVSPPASCLINDNCATEKQNIVTTSGIQTCVTGCNIGSTPNNTTLTGSCVAPTGPTVWYQFTTDAIDYFLDVSVVGTGMNPHIQIWTACNTYLGTGCADGVAGTASLSQYRINGATTYIISVSSQDGVTTGTFDLCVRHYPDPSSCNTNSVITSNPPPDVNGNYPPGTVVEFCITINDYQKAACNWLQGIVPSLVGTGWDLTFGTNGINPTVTPSIQGAPFGGITAGTWIFRSAGTVVYNAFPGSPQPNVPLPAGWYFNEPSNADPDNTFGDGNNTPQPNCWAGPGFPPAVFWRDAWFSYTVPSTATYFVSCDHAGAQNTLTDTQLAIYSSSDNSCTGLFTRIGCDDDAGSGFRARTTVALTAGQTIFIQVQGYNNSQGNFGISIQTGSFLTNNVPGGAAVNTNNQICNAFALTTGVQTKGTNSGYTWTDLGNCLQQGEMGPMVWTACFQARTLNQATCTGNASTAIQFKTYADGEIGAWGSIGCITDAPITYASSLDCPLPVQYEYFMAEPNGNQVNLNWAAIEKNNDHFTVEKSVDAYTFVAIDNVKGAGNTTYSKEYQSKDLFPVLGVNYYRIKQVDFDGKFSYSQVREVEFVNPNAFDFQVVPMPFEQSFEIQFYTEESSPINIEIMDMQGKKVITKSVNSALGMNKIQVDNELVTGVYVLKMIYQGQTYHRKITKK